VKATRRKPGTTWHLDEVFVTLRGEVSVFRLSGANVDYITPIEEKRVKTVVASSATVAPKLIRSARSEY